MSGRTCQFCGKPLWRIRRGSEGDFCSREHRNQYQLRRGMSQIIEADKAASIGRRREQPNSAALLRPAGAAALENRRLFAFKNPLAERAAGVSAPPIRLRSDIRINSAAVLRPRLAAHPGAGAGTVVPAALPPGGRVPMPARAGSLRLATGGMNPVEAGAVRVPFSLLARSVASRHRLVSRLWQMSLPAVPPSGPTLRLSGLSTLRMARPVAGKWAAAGQPGHTPRISFQRARSAWVRPQLPVLQVAESVAGMPLAEYALMPYDAIAPSPAHPRPDSQPREWVPEAFQYVALAERCLSVVGDCRLPVPLAPHTIDLAARSGRPGKAIARPRLAARPPRWDCLESPRPETARGALAGAGPRKCAAPSSSGNRRRLVGELTQLPPAPSFPPQPGRRGQASLAEPPAATLRLSALRPTPGAARAGMPPDPGGSTLAGMLRLLEGRRARTPIGAPGLAEPSGHAVALRPVEVRGSSRALETPFPILDPFFEPPQVKIRGGMADFLETQSGPALRLEEHFHMGLESWQGGMGDWKVDVAGVRTGSLALFSPSLGLRDYGLEFLAKIENRSVGWVFRAADLQNYFAVRIVAADSEGGSGELLRYAVIGGVREPAVAAPLGARVRSRAAFTVQLLAAAGDFAVAVDGETICRWSDSRLPSGGVGFLADGEDRARLYWVRLSSPASRPTVAAPETRIGV